MSPELFAAAAMRKVQKDLVAMKVVKLKEELGERESLSGNKAWLRRIVSEYLESAAARRRAECPKKLRRIACACGARFFIILPRAGPLLSFCHSAFSVLTKSAEPFDRLL